MPCQLSEVPPFDKKMIKISHIMEIDNPSTEVIEEVANEVSDSSLGSELGKNGVRRSKRLMNRSVIRKPYLRSLEHTKKGPNCSYSDHSSNNNSSPASLPISSLERKLEVDSSIKKNKRNDDDVNTLLESKVDEIAETCRRTTEALEAMTRDLTEIIRSSFQELSNILCASIDRLIPALMDHVNGNMQARSQRGARAG